MKYIRNLHNMDDKVLSVSPQRGKDNRIFVGIVVICGVHKYCIPLSSSKEKHKKMKNSMDFSKIEVDGKLLGVLNFNLMIPVEEEQLQLIDTTVFKRDRENIKYYKKLCRQELEWCQNNNEVICNSEIVPEVYEVHQMLSANEYPEYAGNYKNKQALARNNGEHLRAHKGNYQNSTCWYYDYESGNYHKIGG